MFSNVCSLGTVVFKLLLITRNTCAMCCKPIQQCKNLTIYYNHMHLLDTAPKNNKGFTNVLFITGLYWIALQSIYFIGLFGFLSHFICFFDQLYFLSILFPSVKV